MCENLLIFDDVFLHILLEVLEQLVVVPDEHALLDDHLDVPLELGEPPVGHVLGSLSYPLNLSHVHIRFEV